MAPSKAKPVVPPPLPLLPLRLHPRRASTAVWAVGRCLFVYDTARGEWEQRRREVHKDTIRALGAAAPSGDSDAAPQTTRWISGGDDKQVIIWEERGGEWESVSTLSHGKKITAALLDGDGRAVFADRFGEVYRWKPGSDDATPQLLLSHLAIVTAMVLVDGGRFLVSGDNHEKIRVSCYPQAYEIHSFCLGHLGQITALADCGDMGLLSASGDGTLRLWQLDGEPTSVCELGCIPSSLCAGPNCTAVVGCEVAPGMRRVHLSSASPGTEGPACGGIAQLPPAETITEESPQAIIVLPSGGVLWVDRRGHLRTPPTTLGGDWGDVFEGEDLPAALASLSKNSGLGDGGAEGDAGDRDDDEEQPRKKRNK